MSFFGHSGVGVVFCERCWRAKINYFRTLRERHIALKRFWGLVLLILHKKMIMIFFLSPWHWNAEITTLRLRNWKLDQPLVTDFFEKTPQLLLFILQNFLQEPVYVRCVYFRHKFSLLNLWPYSTGQHSTLWWLTKFPVPSRHILPPVLFPSPAQIERTTCLE